jgi:hypothetical protein
MALQVDTPFIAPGQIDVQQYEFDKAFADSNKGKYIIVDHNSRYDLTPQMITLIQEHYPEYATDKMYEYRHTSAIYPAIVNIFIDMITGKILGDDDTLHNVTLIWINQDIYDSDSWIYESDSRDDCDQTYVGVGNNIIYLDESKLELYKLKKQQDQEVIQLYNLFTKMTTILQTEEDPLPSLVGLFNPLVITDGIDIHAQVKEANELASLLPGTGDTYGKARDRFNSLK